MDENTRLIIGSTQNPQNWEDREKTTDDVTMLRQEFRTRLYSQEVVQGEQSTPNATGKKASGE